MNIIEIPIENIKPYYKNPRENLSSIDKIADSIKRYGFNQPIVVDKDNVIIIGHTRYFALLRLGYETAPCLVSELSAQKNKQLRIVDNKTNEYSKWDFTKLNKMLISLTEVQHLISDNSVLELIKDQEMPVILNEQDAITKTLNEDDLKLKANIEDLKDRIVQNNKIIMCYNCGKEFIATNA